MKKFSFLYLLLLAGLFTQAQLYVTLHEDCQFRGRTYMLEAGTYRLYQMKIGNDRLSSLQIPAGFRVTLYADDNFSGKSLTLSATLPCLDSSWDNQTSSLVVEDTRIQQINPNEYVVFYTDCYERGFSRSLRPGIYKGADLGELKNNISSFSVFGNLRVRAYTQSEEAMGYYGSFEKNETCLNRNFNDRISSLVIEYNPNPPAGGNGTFSDDRYVQLFADCRYEGNGLRLEPGRYTGENLGLFRNALRSLRIPSGYTVRIFSNDNFSGNSTVFTSDEECLAYPQRDKAGSLIVERRGGSAYPGGGFPPVTNVTIYTDAAYRGQSAVLLPGTYGSMAEAGGFPEKALSSLQIPPGYKVILYDQPGLRGRSITLTESRSSFSLGTWNDRAVSIAVYRQ